MEFEFTKSSVPWIGTGVNCSVSSSSYSNVPIVDRFDRLQPLIIRINLHAPSTLNIMDDDDTMDKSWLACDEIASGLVSRTFAAATSVHNRIVVINPPRNWLANSGPSTVGGGDNNELHGDALVSFARVIASCMFVFAGVGINFDFVEIINDPSDSTNVFVTPDNYVVLLQTTANELSRRFTADGITTTTPPPALMGPGATCASQSLYLNALQQSNSTALNLLTAWSIRMREDPLLESSFTNGNGSSSNNDNVSYYASRTVFYRQLRHPLSLMRFFSPSKPLFIIRTSSQRTKFDTGLDYGDVRADSEEYAFRMADLWCETLAFAPSAILSDYIDDRCCSTSLCRRDGVRRPQFDLFGLCSSLIPQQQNATAWTFSSMGTLASTVPTIVPDDQTISAAIVSNNTFCLILSRAQSIDNANGTVTVVLHGFMDITQHHLSSKTSFRCSLMFRCFPNRKTLNNVIYDYDIDIISGDLTIIMTRLPYLCCIFVRGDVYYFTS